MKLKSRVFVLMACAVVCGAHAAAPQPISIESIPMKGAPDTVICGIDEAKTSLLKGLKKKFGKPKFGGKSELTKTYLWKKDGLNVALNVSSEDADRALDVKLSGTDANGLCSTGKGVHLGQTLEEVKSAYGQVSSEFFGDGVLNVSLEWPDNDFYINLAIPERKKIISEIKIQYMLE